MTRDNCLYTPHYCEENVYHLCMQSAILNRRCRVVFISNAGKSVAMQHQRGATGIVVWDYHVILVADGNAVFDLDSTLGFPVSASTYLEQSFPAGVPAELQPLFRIVAASAYLDGFHSDRSHMIRPDGSYLAPPPSWPAIRPELGSNLDDFADMSRTSFGKVFAHSGFGRHLTDSGEA